MGDSCQKQKFATAKIPCAQNTICSPGQAYPQTGDVRYTRWKEKQFVPAWQQHIEPSPTKPPNPFPTAIHPHSRW